MSDKPIVTLEAWQLLSLGGVPFQLYGFASDHPRLAGFRRHIKTSRLLGVDAQTTRAETLNSIYLLHRPMCNFAFDGVEPIRFAIEDLTAQRRPDIGAWQVSRGAVVLARDIPTMDAAILSMLSILDAAPPDPGLRP